jgi:hypothetical protein
VSKTCWSWRKRKGRAERERGTERARESERERQRERQTESKRGERQGELGENKDRGRTATDGCFCIRAKSNFEQEKRRKAERETMQADENSWNVGSR